VTRSARRIPARRLRASLLPSLLSLLVPLILLGASGCKVDANAFQSRIFPCDTASAHPLCGTDQSGVAMTCFAAGQLGGTDFCTQSCTDAPGDVPGEDAVCLQSGSKLETCDPTAGDDACGQAELGCLRTDVTTDEGVCVTMKPCQMDSDCRDPVRSTCASTFFHALYSKNQAIHTDHLYCLQEGCAKNGTACSPGETCLKQVISAAAHPPDICVPNCDSLEQCPPNFLCLKADNISGPANPGVCIPGLLGFKCGSDVDCLVGHCVSDGGDALIPTSKALNLCTVDCASDADCELFDSDQGTFFCNGAHHCVTPQAYLGASCDTDADCTRDPLTTKCTHFSADPTVQGTCIHQCPDGGTCPALGGVPHTCYKYAASAPSVCLPGTFGLPCSDDTVCVGNASGVGGLTCRNVSASTKVCTTLCQKDADCEGNRWTAGQGFCGGSVCLPFGSLPKGSPCAADKQCDSNSCVAASDMSGAPSTCGGK
jgi:hypothetical protein